MSEHPSPEELLKVDYKPPKQSWLDPKPVMRRGVINWSAVPKSVEYLGLPFARRWQPTDEDWKLPENWKDIILEGLRDRLDRFRTLRIFMDICVRCGACADNCHYFIGSGDPKNMPV